MTGEEGRQPLGHAAGILHLQQVPGIGKDEGLGVGEPREQQFLSLSPDAIQFLTPRPDDGKDWLDDATRVVPGERPLLEGGQFLAEERVRIGHVLVEGSRSARSSTARYRGPQTPRKKVSMAPALSPAR